MRRTLSPLMFGAALAVTLAACTSTPMPTTAQATPCRETGLTNAADSRLGQLDCGPVAATTR